MVQKNISRILDAPFSLNGAKKGGESQESLLKDFQNFSLLYNKAISRHPCNVLLPLNIKGSTFPGHAELNNGWKEIIREGRG